MVSISSFMYLNTSRKGMKYLVDRSDQHPMLAKLPLDAAALSNGLAIDAAAKTFLQTAADRLDWSGRAVHRLLKVAPTIADLAGSERIAVAHVAEGVRYRRSIRPS